jgi:hypothetical protein
MIYLPETFWLFFTIIGYLLFFISPLYKGKLLDLIIYPLSTLFLYFSWNSFASGTVGELNSAGNAIYVSAPEWATVLFLCFLATTLFNLIGLVDSLVGYSERRKARREEIDDELQ